MLTRVRARLAELLPMTAALELRRIWAATIDYTPDHLPILGPLLDAGGEPVAGATLASAGGHGMMWGPAVARAPQTLRSEARPPSPTSRSSEPTGSTSTAAAASRPTRSRCRSRRRPDAIRPPGGRPQLILLQASTADV